MDRNKIKMWVDIGMGISFLLVVLTGIFKWPGLSQTIFSEVFKSVNFKVLSIIHDWSGIVMALFVLIHLILNRQWIKSMILCTLNKNKECKIKNE